MCQVWFISGTENTAGTRPSPWIHAPDVQLEVTLENRQINEQTNHTKWRVLQIKSKSAMLSVAKGRGGDSDHRRSVSDPDIEIKCWEKETGKIWGKGVLSRALRPNYVWSVKGRKILVERGLWEHEEGSGTGVKELQGAGTRWEWGIGGGSTKLIQICLVTISEPKLWSTKWEAIAPHWAVRVKWQSKYKNKAILHLLCFVLFCIEEVVIFIHSFECKVLGIFL